MEKSLPSCRWGLAWACYRPACSPGWLRTDLVKVEERLRTDLVTVEERLRADIKQLADRVGRLEYGQAKLEGLLEGLREAITGRAAS